MISVCLAAVWLTFAQISLVQPSAPDTDLSVLAATLREELGVPAIAIGITASEGEHRVAIAGHRTSAGEDPVTIDSRFHLGSLTKSMTATAAARLVERGVIRWDTTVGETDPELAAQLPESARGITLAQLLSHRAGLPDDRSPGPIHMRLWMLDGPIRDQRHEATRLILSNNANAAPSEAMIYSNGGYIVAGWMLETAAGASWEDILRKEVFEPIGITHAGFGPPGLDPADDRQPLGHGRQGDQLNPVPALIGADNPPVSGPAGRVHCSITDLAAYARFHLRGLRDEPGDRLPHDAFVRLHADPEGDGYALGWGIQGEGKDRRSMHAGSNTRWYAVILVWPDRDLAVVAAMNAMPKSDPPVDILRRLLDAADKAESP
jgi:CubicO group peptidase (beta-lactamase class C family)